MVICFKSEKTVLPFVKVRNLKPVLAELFEALGGKIKAMKKARQRWIHIPFSANLGSGKSVQVAIRCRPQDLDGTKKALADATAVKVHRWHAWVKGYCWWTRSCTGWYVERHIFNRAKLYKIFVIVSGISGKQYFHTKNWAILEVNPAMVFQPIPNDFFALWDPWIWWGQRRRWSGCVWAGLRCTWHLRHYRVNPKVSNWNPASSCDSDPNISQHQWMDIRAWFANWCLRILRWRWWWR